MITVLFPRLAVILLFCLGILDAPAAAQQGEIAATKRVKAFCIDFNWGPGGPNGFPRPGTFAQADPKAHYEWYRDLGVDTIQTFCVSCNGYAWYKDSQAAPVQPGLEHDFLKEITTLAHGDGIRVMGYFCVGANTWWGLNHPDESYGAPSAIHIPLTSRYLDFLCSSIRDALTRTEIDGFMIDWVFSPPVAVQTGEKNLRWLDCEKEMYSELFGRPFPGKEALSPHDELLFQRRALERCWKRIRSTALSAKPDCVIWLSCFDLNHPQAAGSTMLQEADWVMNETPDPRKIDTARRLIGEHATIIQCLCGGSAAYDAARLMSDPAYADVGWYGFAPWPDTSTTLPPEKAVDAAQAAIRKNINSIRQFYRAEGNAATVFPVRAGGLPRPTPEQYLWHEQERIMFVCIDPCTWQGREYDNHTTPLSDMKLPRLDTDQWCRAARAWGAREILFVAKHTGGFCWWRTDTTDYCVKNIAWKDGQGDLLVDLARSCRRFGLSLGIYIYPGDESWGAGIGSGGRTRDPAKQEAYNEVFRRQLGEAIEIAAHYTPVSEVWFDGSCIIEVGDILAEKAPHAVVFQGPHATIRWVGNERGRLAAGRSWSTLTRENVATGLATAQHSDPAGDAWAPLEVNTTLYEHHWFWAPSKEAKRKSLDELMHVYYQSAGQGAVMLLNSTPNSDGLIPEADMHLYCSLGAEIERRFGCPVAAASGLGGQIDLDLHGARVINHAVIMEEYRHGERIRHYVIEGWGGNGWQKLCEGKHVGRKRIDFFDDSLVTRVRMRVIEAAAIPLIRSFQVFHVASFRPAPGKAVQSAWGQCAEWKADDFKGGAIRLDVDLTPHIKEAGQWRIRFEPLGSADILLRDGILFQAGQAATPGILTRVDGAPDTFNLNRTAVVTEEADIRLRVVVEGAPCSGAVLIRNADPEKTGIGEEE